MTWRDYLTDQERRQLERAEAKRAKSEDEQRALRRLLKSRAESRMRVAKRQKMERS